MDTIDMMDLIWAPGSHSLCAQINGSPFKKIGHYDDPQALIEAAGRLPENANVWWGVHAMDPPEKGRGGAEHVTAVCTLAADFDWADDEAHKATELPTEAMVRLTVSQMEPAPTIVVNSGHGLQVYWALHDEIDAATAERLSDGFFRHVETLYGLSNDRKDLASVLRLPGTYNNKAEPVEVLIEQLIPEGYSSQWLFDNAWESPVRLEPSAPSVVEIADLVKPQAHVSHETDNPKEWAKENFSVYDHLVRRGWHTGLRKGDEEYMTRPSKGQRDSSSATMHHDTNTAYIYSKGSMDTAEYERVGWEGVDGGRTINGFDAYMVENGFTVSGEAMSAIRRSGQMPSVSPAQRDLTPEPGTHMQVSESSSPTNLNLPDEFWEQREWLGHVRDAAHVQMLNPTSVLGAVLVRYAASISPRVQLPAVVGSTGTFDLFTMLVGDPGSGKSTSWSCAKALMPELPKLIRDDVPLGTGEGLVEMMYARVNEEGQVTGKKSDERRLHYEGVCVMVNEGRAINEQSARTGSVIIETLCQAWMGETLGQANASEDTFRHVPAKTRRITACIGIQTENAPLIFRDKFKATGLPQRMIALWAHPDWLPDDDTLEWPGELHLPKPAIVGEVTVLTAAPEIRSLIRNERRAVALRDTQLHELDVHLRLLQLKLAGIMTAADGLTHISIEHWNLASAILDSHKAMRQRIHAEFAQQETSRRVTQGTRQAEISLVAEEHVDRALLTKCIKRIRDLLDHQGTWTEGVLKNRLSPKQQPYFEEAVDNLVVSGDVTVADGHITKI